MKNLIYKLKERGFIDSVTDHKLFSLTKHPIKVYAGFDPTSNSLHLGNLIAMIGLAWFHRFGHKPIALIGGATGMIGDPSGRNTERNILDSKTIHINSIGIRRSLEAVLKTDVMILDNASWFREMGYISFLRDIGKFFRLGPMLAKESVKTRLTSKEGISYTEFSYQLFQAYDFLHLFREHEVTLQIGGSDQWGNIVAGTELVRRLTGTSVNGMTFPLLTRSDGKKFGKSEKGAIWLNPDRLPSYDFYQYFFSIPDADIPKMFRMLTFLDLEEIREIEDSMRAKDYIPNSAQRRLAEEVTKIVHGQQGLNEAISITKAAQPGSHTQLTSETLRTLVSGLPSQTLLVDKVVGVKLIDLLVKCHLLESKGEARRMIIGGGVSLNNVKVSDEELVLSKTHLVENEFVLISLGKKKKLVIRIS
ncbi:MAG: tyrosine--tRNA ligase [Chlamydiales bacterium]